MSKPTAKPTAPVKAVTVQPDHRADALADLIAMDVAAAVGLDLSNDTIRLVATVAAATVGSLPPVQAVTVAPTVSLAPRINAKGAWILPAPAAIARQTAGDSPQNAAAARASVAVTVQRAAGRAALASPVTGEEVDTLEQAAAADLRASYRAAADGGDAKALAAASRDFLRLAAARARRLKG
jgi:hypothetical protein